MFLGKNCLRLDSCSANIIGNDRVTRGKREVVDFGLENRKCR